MNRLLTCVLLLTVGCGMAVESRQTESNRAAVSTVEPAPERLTKLAVGDPAPPLRLGHFVKGEPFASFEPGRNYVVEFSATWCGPCRAAIPHLTQLQRQYPDVTFLSVYVREDDRDAPRKFVDEMGDRIGYRVAVDDVPEGAVDEKGVMWQTWMEATGNRGIPEAFVVDGTGRIVAITDPRILAEPLAKIVAGQWDLNVAMAQFRKDVLANRQRDEFDNRLKAILESQPSREMLENLNALKAEFPKEKHKDELMSILWGAFRRFARPDGDDGLAISTAKELLDFQASECPQHAADFLNGIAWEFVDPSRTQQCSQPLLLLALDSARRADELSEASDPQVADTFARALFLLGHVKLAYRTQHRAVRFAMAASDRNQPLIAELQARLHEYAAAVGED